MVSLLTDPPPTTSVASPPTTLPASSQPSPAPEGARGRAATFVGWHGIRRLFSSVQLAITLLSCLIIGVLLGVFLPQEGLVETAQIRAQFASSYLLMKSLGLFNVYGSPWFIALEVLFFFNLLLGSFQWLKPAFIAATKTVFCPVTAIVRAPTRFACALPPGVTSEELLAHCLPLLRRFGYHVRVQQQQGALQLAATKGSWSRLGPALAHIGILMLLLGSLYGALTGFKAQKLAVPGETFALSQAQSFITNVPEPFWLGHVPNWQVRIQDFNIEVYPDHPETVRQYRCDLDIIDGGQQVRRSTISVNHPLSYDGVTIYQAAFQPTGRLFLTLNGRPRTVQVNAQFQGRGIAMLPIDARRVLLIFPFYVQKDPGVRENHLVAFLRQDGGFFGARPGRMPAFLRLRPGQSQQLGPVRLGFVRPEIATGLQIKKAPETAWVYSAFAIIALGTVMCLFSQRKLWLAADLSSQTLYVLYKTNKGWLGFQKELARLQQQLQQQMARGAQRG